MLMGVHRIEVSLDKLQKLADELLRLADRIDKAPKSVNAMLVAAAAEEARNHYSDRITVEETENAVRATGNSVAFEEFGAGARISDPFPDGADVDFEIRKGAYSDLHEGEYAKSGYESWHHGGEEYKYVTPTNALFYARERAIAEIPEAANELNRIVGSVKV